MLQLLHPDVFKVDQVLHIGCAWEAADSADDVRGGLGDIQDSAGPLPVRCLASLTS
jgi:hypothetical protein